jgi:putative spermidine/putrescine transport system permease protein
MKKIKIERVYHNVVLAILMLILIAPIFATALYSVSTSWGATLLPDGLTLDWYYQLWTDERFLTALFRSLWICFMALLVAIVLIFPVIFVVDYYFPKLKPLMNLVVILPFAIPPVVSSVGLLQIYSDEPLTLTGTPWILIGCYFMIALPFIYRAIENNLSAINLRDLVDTAHLLGASTFQAVWQIILPNLRNGMLSAIFLSFSFLIGEFLFANMLVGGQYETLQVYLYNIRNRSGHYSSALVVSYFLLILIATLLANTLSREKRKN